MPAQNPESLDIGGKQKQSTRRDAILFSVDANVTHGSRQASRCDGVAE
jgi:hypothetical protein